MTPSRPAASGRLARLFPLFALGALAGSAALVRAQPLWLAPAVVAVLLGAAFLWLLLSVFWPAKADRGCPACGREALVRMDPESTRGLRCEACGHRDPDASSWFLAEEEGPLEEIVLGKRGRGRR